MKHILGGFLLCVMFLALPGAVLADVSNNGMAGSCSDEYTAEAQIERLTTAGGQANAEQATMLSDALAGNGFLSKTAVQIKDMVLGAAEQLYKGITSGGSGGFAGLVASLMVLYVIIFGAMFMLGMVQAPLYDMMVRLVKMIAVAAVVGPGGWAFFNEHVVALFISGSEYIITEMVSTMASYMGGMVGGVFDIANAQVPVFAPLDILFAQMIQPSTMMVLQGMAELPPYGPVYMGILVLAGVFMIGAIARALWVYMMSILALAFLFGVAPLFVVTILFERTKGMFMAWIGQVVNFTLQPVLMFTFLAFFVMLMQVSITQIMELKVCYGELYSNVYAEGSGARSYGLRFVVGDNMIVSHCEADGCKCVLPGSTTEQDCPGAGDGGLPFDLMSALTFLLLAYVAFQFYNNVVDIANDISGSYISLDAAGASPVRDMVDSVSKSSQAAAVKAIQGDTAGALQSLNLGSLGSYLGATPPTTRR